MSARPPHPARGAAAKAPSAAPAWNWAADLGRQQAAVIAESTNAWFRGFEAMRKIQQQAAHQASQRHAAALERLRKQDRPADLLAMQGELLRSDIEGATRYWQQMAATALEMNTEILGCGAHLINTEDVFAPVRLLHS